jgi:uncharacterized protein (UPF0335 family)
MEGDNYIGIDRDALQSFVGRIELLHDERDGITASIANVYREAKDAGFDKKAMRQVIRERAMDPDERIENYATLDDYREALGMLIGTPLGDYATSQHAEYPPPSRRRGRPRGGATHAPSARKDRPLDFVPDESPPYPGDGAGEPMVPSFLGAALAANR